MRCVKGNSPRGGSRTSSDSERKRSCGTGFTIIEVALIVFIIGILVVVAVPVYRNYTYRSFVKLSISHVRILEQAIEKHKLEAGVLPSDLKELRPFSAVDAQGNPVSQALPYLDPWGNPYRYLNLLTDNYPTCPNARRDKNNHPLNPDFDLFSKGADGKTVKQVNQSFGKDDIVRADSGKFLGLGADY